jgi:Protein of unknown function (DUF3105)
MAMAEASSVAALLLLLVGCDNPPPTPGVTASPTAISLITGPLLTSATATISATHEITYTMTAGSAHRDGKIDYATIPPNVIPPVGGPHNPVWLNCGIYDQPVADENAVHDLEHGAVWITYQPSLASDALTTLRGIARQYQKVLLSPYPGISAPIIASAWGNQGHTGYQIKFNPGDWNTLQAFLKRHSGASDAPEPNSPCTGGLGNPLP